MSAWLREIEGGVLLTVYVQPGAKTTECAGLHDDALKIRLAAPAIEGKANAALVAFLAKRLEVAKSQVEVVKGQLSRRKSVAIRGVASASALHGLLVDTP